MKSHFNSLHAPALSVSQLSQKWGVTPHTIRKLIKDGKLDAMKLGGKNVILAHDWSAFEQKYKTNQNQTQNLSEEQTIY